MAEGKIVRVTGPVVTAEGLEGARMFDVVRVGQMGLVGEVIKLQGNIATLQIYEDTTGVRPGEKVINTGQALSVELGPGLLTSIYDGIQRPLNVLKEQSGDFISRGLVIPALDEKKKWDFVPTKKKGDKVTQGEIIGTVQETALVSHKVMVPPGVSGELKEINGGKHTIREIVAKVKTTGADVDIYLASKWRVRTPRPITRKLPPDTPLLTGQRVFDTFFPVAKGGTAAIPGPFGSGKCVTGDTPVQKSDGELVPIQSLYEAHVGFKEVDSQAEEEFLRSETGVGLHSLKDRKISQSNSKLLYKGKSDSVIEVRTRTGRRAKVTPVHKLFRVTETGEIAETMAKDLHPGDFIASVRKLDIDNPDQPLDAYSIEGARTPDPEIRQLMRELAIEASASHAFTGLKHSALATISRRTGAVNPKLAWVKQLCEAMNRPVPRPKHLIGARHGALVRIPEKVTPALAEFLGLYVAEGYVRGKGTVVFTNSDPRLRNKFLELSRLLFGVEGREEFQEGKTPNVLVGSRVLVEFLSSLGVGRTAHDKAIPSILQKSSMKSLASFFDAYFAGDGSFSGGQIELCTASPTLHLQLSYLLTRFGILHSLKDKNIDGTEYHRIFITSVGNVGLLLDVLKVGNPKRETIRKHVETSHRGSDSIDVVPVSRETIERAYRKYGSYANLVRSGVEIHNYIGNSERLSSTMYKKFVGALVTQSNGVLLETDRTMHELAESLEYIYCDEIVSLSLLEGPFDVYDVSLPESGRNFVGGLGGMLLHNTVSQQQLAKWSDSKIIVYVGCGERGNEMTEVLATFPELEDPRSKRPLMERTILVANTSNMPVAAREASIYTGITIAEYYRDMGYDVALMADSTSRWAEALREISGRLEEMPGEEGYPAYLGTRLAEFYERSGKVVALSPDERVGSVTVVGAVSPPGGDFSEPVSQNTLRVTRVFWALDASLAARRHFPSINWLTSYSLYTDDLRGWYQQNVAKDWPDMRTEALGILQKEAELQDIVQLVGYDALPESEKGVMDTAKMIREDYLQQSAYDPVDTYTSVHKQYIMMNMILTFGRKEAEAIKSGAQAAQIAALPVKVRIGRVKWTPEDQTDAMVKEIAGEMDQQFDALVQEVKV